MSSSVRANRPTWSSVRESCRMPRARDQAVRRLEAVHAAERRRADDRAGGLAAQRERHHAGGDRGCRAARGAAGRVLGVVRIARLAGREVRALGGHRLAEDHRAGGAQAFHHDRVVARRAALVQHGAVLGRHVGGVDDVLHADRHAVQRADRLARALALVGRARLRERVLLVEELPRLDLRLEPRGYARGRPAPAPPRSARPRGSGARRRRRTASQRCGSTSGSVSGCRARSAATARSAGKM